MLASPRRLAAAALLLLAGLILIANRPAPLVPVADAARWEGQAVRMQGLLVPNDNGFSLDLVADGHALRVAGRDEGIRGLVEVSGRLMRIDGQLALWPDAAPKPVPAHPVTAAAAYLLVRGEPAWTS